MELTRRLAQSRENQYHGHVRPGDLLSAFREVILTEFIKLKRLPQDPAQPYVSEVSSALDANLTRTNTRYWNGTVILKQFELLEALSKKMFGKC
jgi:hypothetical protein